MNNINVYAETTFERFDEKPLNEVDSLIFSWLSYFHFEAHPDLESAPLPLHAFYRAEIFSPLITGMYSRQEDMRLLAAVCASPRFRDITLSDYRHETDSSKQFAAVTFHLNDHEHYVAFRGTDNTLVGWKEDCMLALGDTLPAQADARDYLNDIAAQTEGTLYVGGHSKGGNLAVFAAAQCAPEAQERITVIYSHDGPGFLTDVLTDEGFSVIRDRIRKTVPQASLIGLLLSQEAEHDIVESSAISVMQHYPFSWKVDQDAFIRRSKFSADSQLLYRKVNAWVDSLDKAQRAEFIESLFHVLGSAGTDEVSELVSNAAKYLPNILHAIKALDREHQFFLLRTVHLLLSAAPKDKKLNPEEHI